MKLFFCFIFLTTGCLAHASFLPQNYLHTEDNLNSIQNVNKAEFDWSISRAMDVYAPIVSSFGYNLRIEGDWQDSTVNAYAYQSGVYWVVKMFGGLARRPEITLDGFMGVICHELGHHLGGFPYVASWAAAEGQSDYYATKKCMDLMWQNETQNNELAANKAPMHPKAICQGVYGDYHSQNLCIRKLAAGHSLATMLNGGSAVSWVNRDPTVVRKTYTSHPRAQCRFDTYVAGAVCNKNYNEFRIYRTEYEQMNSICGTNDPFGSRPLCWFKPASRKTQ